MVTAVSEQTRATVMRFHPDQTRNNLISWPRLNHYTLSKQNFKPAMASRSRSIFLEMLEAVKSISDKLRTQAGLTDDGVADRAFAGDPPMLAVNLLKTESEKNEQRGFASLLRGTFGMFRNTTAHAARIYWPMTKGDAEDLFSVVSLIHRRLDGAHMPPRA